jgi:large-conductance mechanosensitive channel
MLKQCRSFVRRCHPLDITIGLIAGAAFGAAVNTLVIDLVTPALLLLRSGAHVP